MVEGVGGIGDEHIVHPCIGIGIDLIGYEPGEDGGGHGDRVPMIRGLICGGRKSRPIVFYDGGGLEGKMRELYLADGLGCDRQREKADEACADDGPGGKKRVAFHMFLLKVALIHL